MAHALRGCPLPTAKRGCGGCWVSPATAAAAVAAAAAPAAVLAHPVWCRALRRRVGHCVADQQRAGGAALLRAVLLHGQSCAVWERLRGRPRLLCSPLGVHPFTCIGATVAEEGLVCSAPLIRALWALVVGASRLPPPGCLPAAAGRMPATPACFQPNHVVAPLLPNHVCCSPCPIQPSRASMSTCHAIQHNFGYAPAALRTPGWHHQHLPGHHALGARRAHRNRRVRHTEVASAPGHRCNV